MLPEIVIAHNLLCIPQEQLAFQAIDDNVWDSKYSERYGELDFGVSSEQGPRESMEDCAHIIPRARCGFLFAAVFDGHSGFAASQLPERPPVRGLLGGHQ